MGGSLKSDCYGSRAFRFWEADFGDHPSISEFLKLVLHIHSFSEFLATRAPRTVNIFDSNPLQIGACVCTTQNRRVFPLASTLDTSVPRLYYEILSKSSDPKL